FYSQTTTLFLPATTLLKTVNLTTTSATDKVLIEAEFDYAKNGTASYVAIALYRNGVEIHEVAKYSVANADNSVKLTWVDVPAVGAQVYTLRYYQGAGAIATFYGSNLVATVLP
ncbi:hypothetical protein MEO39_27200, partial [Dolichospermum sp. ST_sed2]|nr:hypothetical protein [Dolichospermum sp. ST_sed2]